MRRSKELAAFAYVPIVAALAWYVAMMAHLLFANGRLRFRTDLLSFGYGTVVIGLPVAIVITVVITLPLYLIGRRLHGIGPVSSILGGLCIGGGASLVAYLMEDPSLMPAWVGPSVGATSAVCWWLLAGKPSFHSRDKSAT